MERKDLTSLFFLGLIPGFIVLFFVLMVLSPQGSDYFRIEVPTSSPTPTISATPTATASASPSN